MEISLLTLQFCITVPGGILQQKCIKVNGEFQIYYIYSSMIPTAEISIIMEITEITH